MIEPTLVTWILLVGGAVTFLPLLVAQTMMIFQPRSKATRELLVGKGEDWRNETHFKTALAFAWADWLVIFPLLILGGWGVIEGLVWGYVLWLALGCISIYFSVLCWIVEKEYTYPSRGPWVYYTYYWGFFLYWGIAAIIYSLIQLI